MPKKTLEKITWKDCQVRLGDLKKWEHNPAEISKEAAGRLMESLNDFGQAQVILIEPDNTLLDGHQRLDVWGSKLGEDYMVKCQMASRKFTEKERRKFAIFLRSGTTGRYNFDELANWDSADLKLWGLDEKYKK